MFQKNLSAVWSWYQGELRPSLMLTPQFASASTGNHYITPGDFAILYDVAPVYVGGVDGTGQKIPRWRLQHISGEVRFPEWTWGTSGWLTQYTGYELFGSGTRSLLWLLRNQVAAVQCDRTDPRTYSAM